MVWETGGREAGWQDECKHRQIEQCTLQQRTKKGHPHEETSHVFEAKVSTGIWWIDRNLCVAPGGWVCPGVWEVSDVGGGGAVVWLEREVGDDGIQHFKREKANATEQSRTEDKTTRTTWIHI